MYWLNIPLFLTRSGYLTSLVVLLVSTHFRGCESGEFQKSGGEARVMGRELGINGS